MMGKSDQKDMTQRKGKYGKRLRRQFGNRGRGEQFGNRGGERLGCKTHMNQNCQGVEYIRNCECFKFPNLVCFGGKIT
jgi:hypothetical protein